MLGRWSWCGMGGGVGGGVGGGGSIANPKVLGNQKNMVNKQAATMENT